MSLYSYYRTNTGLPINKWAHYFPVYERHFAPFRDRSIVFLEIGSGQGGSSRMWRDYFGPLAQIVTLDIRPECVSFEDEQIAVRIGSQDDAGFLRAVVEEFGAPDIVLDDGSHHMAHMLASLDVLYPLLAREAVYMVEDTHTAYWRDWGGGLKKPGTFIEEMKALVDALHSDNPHHVEQADEAPQPTDLSRTTRGLHFYDSMVVLEKGPYLSKYSRSLPHVEGQKVW